MMADFNAPLDRIVSFVLSSAVDNGVKEIHIELQAFDAPVHEAITGLSIPLSFARCEGAVVSFKGRDGLEQQVKLPHYILQPLLARVQELSDARPSPSHGFPEGRLPFEHGSKRYDWQVLVGPNELGEKLVLRQTHN